MAEEIITSYQKDKIYICLEGHKNWLENAYVKDCIMAHLNEKCLACGNKQLMLIAVDELKLDFYDKLTNTKMTSLNFINCIDNGSSLQSGWKHSSGRASTWSADGH